MKSSNMVMTQLKKIFVRRMCVFLLGIGLPTSVIAQTPAPRPNPQDHSTWTAELPGGTYSVMLGAINSISQHEYVVDGAARVTEVNIDTMGPLVVRFYYIGPNTPQTPDGIGQSGADLLEEKAKEVMERAGGEDIGTKVVKNYPTTTHAGTVEYRLATLESLEKLFKSVQQSWLSRKAGKFKP